MSVKYIEVLEEGHHGIITRHSDQNHVYVYEQKV